MFVEPTASIRQLVSEKFQLWCRIEENCYYVVMTLSKKIRYFHFRKYDTFTFKMVYLHFKVYYHAKYPAVTYDSSKRKHLEGFFKIAFGNHRMLLERERERARGGIRGRIIMKCKDLCMSLSF